MFYWRQYHRVSTDHILNVEHCTYFFSDTPRSLHTTFRLTNFLPKKSFFADQLNAQLTLFCSKIEETIRVNWDRGCACCTSVLSQIYVWFANCYVWNYTNSRNTRSSNKSCI